MDTIDHTESLADKAEKIARKAHAGQFRRDGKTPYIVHPQAVVSRVSSDEEKAVAWLHDVIEDTGLSSSDLAEAHIPKQVIDAVKLLTKNDGVPYETYLEKVKTNPLARSVKIADMLSNLADQPSKKQIVKYAQGLLALH